jgi:hypothetical protein
VIRDTQDWLNNLQQDLFNHLPIGNKRKFQKRTFYLSASALAHIVERHYYKIPRHPGCGKFTIPLADLLGYIRDAYDQPSMPLRGTINVQRIIHADRNIGFDQAGASTHEMTIISNPTGMIITAFPGITY